tara:strand:+ start:78 stop:764 length:687 start_codon:yes stop_codon:yes gene_type:complete
MRIDNNKPVVKPKEKFSPQQLKAIELLASNPYVDKKFIAKEVGVSYKSIYNWMNKADFIDRFYTRYMEVAGVELPLVVGAMIEEAKAGNVHAGRLVLEHFGKLEKKIKIQVESPFEKFLKDDAEEVSYEEVDPVSNEFIEELHEVVVEKIELPPRDKSNDKPRLRQKKEKKKLKEKIQEKAQQSNAYQIRKRAKEVGLELLKGGRQSKATRQKWLAELERLETEKKSN